MPEKDGIGSKFTDRTGVKNQCITEAEWQGRKQHMDRPTKPTYIQSEDEFIKASFEYMRKLERYCDILEKDIVKLGDIIEDQLAMIESQLKIIELNPPDMELKVDDTVKLPDPDKKRVYLYERAVEESPVEKIDMWTNMWYNFKKYFKRTPKKESPFDE